MTLRRVLRDSERGEQIRVDYDNAEAVNRAVARVIALALKALPAGAVFEIRGKTRPDDPIYKDRLQREQRTREERAKDWGVAWYWTSAEARGPYGGMQQEPIFHHPVSEAQTGPFGGYIIIARLKVE